MIVGCCQVLRDVNLKRVNGNRIRKTFQDPTNTEILVMLYMKIYEGHELDNKYLAALCGVDRRIIRRSISNLIARGWISPRKKRGNYRGRKSGCGVLRYDFVREIPQSFWDEFSEQI
jgi:DNA-binding MarR family transcriptional regulator